MARKIIVSQTDSAAVVLSQEPADDEAQLQNLLKENPELFSMEEFGLTGPLMVVGEETTLPSGSVDLIGITREGAIVIIEFKTGPQNPDFRRAVAQLLDYGSDVWRMTYDEFENAVAVRYFLSDRCRDARSRGLQSIEEAARNFWDDLTDGEWETLKDHLTHRLAEGSFEYVLGAQAFTPSALRTVEYLNTVSSGPRIYAVELVRLLAIGLTDEQIDSLRNALLE